MHLYPIFLFMFNIIRKFYKCILIITWIIHLIIYDALNNYQFILSVIFALIAQTKKKERWVSMKNVVSSIVLGLFFFLSSTHKQWNNKMGICSQWFDCYLNIQWCLLFIYRKFHHDLSNFNCYKWYIRKIMSSNFYMNGRSSLIFHFVFLIVITISKMCVLHQFLLVFSLK